MENIKKKIKAVIFDMDGTIIDTESIWQDASKKLIIDRGVKVFTQSQHDFFESLAGIGLLQSGEALKNEFGLVETPEMLAVEVQKNAHEMFQSNLNFIKGFETFHKKLQAHRIPTSIATNAAKECLSLISNKMELKRFFGANQYCIAHVGNKAKPDPAIFLHAAKQLNVEPHECVVFEDSIFGFQAAQAAGMKCIAIKNSINKHQLELVSSAIESYHEAEEALKKI